MSWPDTVEEILAGDQAVMLASVTPAGGVVLGPVTNFATHDRDAGTVTVNSSIGAWKKLERIRHNPRVALAFHTREHGSTDRPEYVLVQGTASLSQPIADYPATIGENWERFDGPRGGALWRRWLRVYYTRVSIDVAVQRVTVWPDLAASGTPQVYGEQPPAGMPSSQRPPARGTGPRVDCDRATRAAAGLPNVLLGWVDTDGFPLAVPVELDGKGGNGIVLRTTRPLLPPGGRRAGLTAHAFTRYVTGQHQRVHTGWLEAEDAVRHATYAPHTRFGYRLPPSTLLYRLVVGLAARRGLRTARKTGVSISA